eukprot:UN00965
MLRTVTKRVGAQVQKNISSKYSTIVPKNPIQSRVIKQQQATFTSSRYYNNTTSFSRNYKRFNTQTQSRRPFSQDKSQVPQPEGQAAAEAGQVNPYDNQHFTRFGVGDGTAGLSEHQKLQRAIAEGVVQADREVVESFNHLDETALNQLRHRHISFAAELNMRAKTDPSPTAAADIERARQEFARLRIAEEKDLLRYELALLREQLKLEQEKGTYNAKTAMRKLEELRAKHMKGSAAEHRIDAEPRSYKALFAIIALSALGVIYLKVNETKTIANAQVVSYQVAGKLDIGGDFYNLIDQNGEIADSTQYKGQFYPLIYFGFTHCPDICPTELTKMMKALDIIENTDPEVYRRIKPIFISVDPLRDTEKRLQQYSKEFHPRIRWLTGKYEDLLEVAKKFRVYFSIPEDATPDSEYNVDHSIFFFLMDKQGELLNYYGQNKTAEEIAEAMGNVIREDIINEELLSSPALPPQNINNNNNQQKL